MAKPLERTIVAKVMAEARAAGWWVMKNHGSQFSLAGVPDLIAIKEGRAAWMEVKRPGERPTKIQELRMAELRNAGCSVATVTTPSEAVAFLESADPRTSGRSTTTTSRATPTTSRSAATKPAGGGSRS